MGRVFEYWYGGSGNGLGPKKFFVGTYGPSGKSIYSAMPEALLLLRIPKVSSLPWRMHYHCHGEYIIIAHA